MVGLPPRAELVGLVGLGLGFVLFTFGILGRVSGGGGSFLVAVGGLIGLVSVGYLYVYYRLIQIATGH